MRKIYLPEVVHLAVDQGLVLPLDVIDVLDVTGVEVLLHHEAQEAVVWSVCCNSNTHQSALTHSQLRISWKSLNLTARNQPCSG